MHRLGRTCVIGALAGPSLLRGMSVQRRTIGTSAATAVPSSTRRHLERLAARLPPAGMSASQLQAVLDDEYPLLGQVLASQSSVYEALRSHPDLFVVEQWARGRWVVRPAAAYAPAASTAVKEDLRTVERYCAKTLHERHGARGDGVNPFLPMEQVLLGCGIDSVDVVDAVVSGESPVLEARVGLSVKPKRTPRAAHVFVDGDELPAAAVDEMCTHLTLIKEECSVCIIRRAGSAPLSAVDVVSSDLVPTYLSIEKAARELRIRSPVVLRDVIYMCSGRQFATYAEHVAPSNTFPDADVYVCCPSRIELIHKKLVIPYDE